MKYSYMTTLLIPILLSGVAPFMACAQTYSAKVIDIQTGNGIAYANIGIPEIQVGTNSDENGDFTLTAPTGNNVGTLRISMIGYSTLSIPFQEFVKRMDANDKVFKIHKTETSLSEIIVRPQKMTIARLGNFNRCDENGMMLSMPYVLAEKRKRNGDIRAAADTITEIGTLMRVKGKTTFLDSITINVARSTYPEIFYRVNIYEMMDGEYRNILTEPIYIRRRREQAGRIITVSLTDKNIVVHHDFIVSLERVKDLGPGEFAVCASMGGSKAFMRIASHQSTFVKLPVLGFAIAAHVTFIDPIK